MSLILDALRKMEQERRNSRGGTRDLRPEVLRYRMATQPKTPPRYPLLVAGLVLLCAGVGAGFLLNGKQAEVPLQATREVAVSTPAPPPEPVEAPEAEPAAGGASDLLSGPAAASPLGGEEGGEEKASQPAPVSAPAAAAPQPVPHREEVAQPLAAPPEISISGIAYQDERRLRRAVLNGELVGEGAEVAGARVVEIRETKVRLSRGGRIFEIPFSSGLR